MEREAYALKEKIKRRPHFEIAEDLGVSIPAISQMIKRALKRARKESFADSKHLNRMMIADLDDLQQKIQKYFEPVEVKDKDTGEVTFKDHAKRCWAWDRQMALHRRRGEFLGVDAPKQVQVAAPGGGPIRVRSSVSEMTDEELGREMANRLGGGK